jgi:hypothetical protein
LKYLARQELAELQDAVEEIVEFEEQPDVLLAGLVRPQNSGQQT